VVLHGERYTYSPSVYHINLVKSFPATDHVGGNSKIPSIVFYDSGGVARAFGNEALQESVIETAEEEEWVPVEW